MATRLKKVYVEDTPMVEGQNNSDGSNDSTSGPTPMVSGSFAFYEMKNGGVHMVYRLAGTEEDIHQEVPAMAVKIAKQAIEGKGPMAGLAKMIGK